MTDEQQEAIEGIRERLPFFDKLFGNDDPGESCFFISVKEARLIVQALDTANTMKG